MNRFITWVAGILLKAPVLGLAKERLSFDAVREKVKVSRIASCEPGCGFERRDPPCGTTARSGNL